MKTRKILVLCLVLVLLVLCLCACGQKNTEQEDDLPAPIVITETDNYVVLTPSSTYENKTLLEYMNDEKANGHLDFTLDSTDMVSSINGIANPADWSKCWMLYTSDASNSTPQWGRIQYQNTIYNSSSLGAASLKISSNAIYIWFYQSF